MSKLVLVGVILVALASAYNNNGTFRIKRDNYRYKDTGWKGKILNSLSATNLLGSSSNDHTYEVDDDTYVAETHGGGGYGHGHSSGYGHSDSYGHGGHSSGYGHSSGHSGHSSGYGSSTHYGNYGGGGGHGHGGGSYNSNVNKSAVGLLGFLSLLSLIQSALTTTTTAAPMPMPMPRPGRNKRQFSLDDEDNNWTGSNTQADKIVQLVIPLLNAVTHAKNRHIPVECTMRQVCLANSLLTKELGDHGKSVGIMLANAVTDILKGVVKNTSKSRSVSLAIQIAARMGRNGRNCNKTYAECSQLSLLPNYYNYNSYSSSSSLSY